jgi:hypothetical protein
METLAFPLFVTMQRNSTGVVSVSMGIFDYGYLVTTRVLHSNDGLRSNTSQYFQKFFQDECLGDIQEAIIPSFQI